MKLHQALLALRHFRRNGFCVYYGNGNLRLVCENTLAGGYTHGCMCPVTYLLWVKKGLFRTQTDYMDAQELLGLPVVKFADEGRHIEHASKAAAIIANAADNHTDSLVKERADTLKRVRRIMCMMFSIHEGNPETAWEN